MAKKFSSYYLSETCHELLAGLAEALGVSRGAVLEMAVRDLAKREDVKATEGVTSRREEIRKKSREPT